MSVHFFVIAGDFWYGSCGQRQRVFRRCHAGILGCLGCGTGTSRPRQHRQGKGGLPRHVRPHGTQVSGEWVGTCWGHAHVAAGVHSVDLAKCVDTHGSLQRHTLGDAVQSGFRGSRKTGLALVRSTQTARHRCLCSASYLPRMKAKIAEKIATPKGKLASHTLHRNRWSSIRSVEAGSSTVADVPCSKETHTRVYDDHVLDGGAVSVPRVSLSSSPTAPSVQTELGYPWDLCGMSCRVESRKVTWPQATEGVESYEHKIQNCLRKLRKTSDVEIVRRKESEIRRTDSEEKKMCGPNVIVDLRM